MQEMIEKELKMHQDAFSATQEKLPDEIQAISETAVKTLKNGGKILLFGNGGSAADAQHIASELTGRFKIERKGLAGIALTTDTSALTAIGNDYGYDRIFDRQVESLANEGDMLIGLSTSGNSPNVNNALKLGRKLGCKTVGFSGKGGGKMHNICDLFIVIPSESTPRIQEMHILIGHIICQAVDNAFE